MIGLEYVMKINSISCTELGRRLEITKQSVSKWLNKRSNISEKYLLVLSEMFDVNKEYLTKDLEEIDFINTKPSNIIKQYSESDINKLNLVSQIRNNIEDKNIELYKKFLLLTEKIDNKALDEMFDSLIKMCNIK